MTLKTNKISQKTKTEKRKMKTIATIGVHDGIKKKEEKRRKR